MELLPRGPKRNQDGWMTESPPLSAPFVYQLRVVLREISPLIWRRLQVRSDGTIADLHATLQLALGWSDDHLNRFVVHGREYGVAHSGGCEFSDDPAQVRLADLSLRAGERFLYEYDFGAPWQHDIRVEGILPLDPGRRYPVCISGRRAVPPEGCGGPWAFLELRQRHSIFQIIRRLSELLEPSGAEEDEDDGDHHGELLELARWLKIDRFDRRAANRRLADQVAASVAGGLA